MIHYQIQCTNPASQFIQIELLLHLDEYERVNLQLPAWRAGRYQLANFAQNIRNIEIIDPKSEPVEFKKTSKDRWEFSSGEKGQYRISYEYFCGKMDAGSAWVDDEQVYVNLVNCCFEVIGKAELEVEVKLDFPQYPAQISTLIPISDSTWKAADFQMLADSTILASKKLIHWEYQIQKIDFHIWIQGEVHIDQEQFLDRFKAFSERLIQDFGKFPEMEYHFIFQLLPYPHYHGVEHRRGTVITFGPAESLQESDQMEELLGISCHELYHAWNVCRIRPKGLLPYDFSKETYLDTGLILEGVTTYMGDLYLLKSGVYGLHTYFKHLEKVIARESASFGWRNHTIVESSFDLWLDGYVPGIPDRKVNIYTHGALLAICLDSLLLQQGSSLAEVMREMWIQFGKPLKGYDLGDFERLILDKFQDVSVAEDFFADFVYGKKDLFPTLKTLLGAIGLKLKETQSENRLLHQFGIRADSEGLVVQLHPDSMAYFFLMKNDLILEFSPLNSSSLAVFQIKRNERILEFRLTEEKGDFFPVYRLEAPNPNSYTAIWRK